MCSNLKENFGAKGLIPIQGEPSCTIPTDRWTDRPDEANTCSPNVAVVPSTCLRLPLGTRFDVLTPEFLNIQVI